MHETRGSASEWFTLRLTERGPCLLDQRRLPAEEIYLTLESVEEVARAIEDMAIRGAPAIACAAAAGIALAAQKSAADEIGKLVIDVEAACERLARTRPTAVNLFRAIDRMRAVLTQLGAGHEDPDRVRRGLLAEARRMLEEDVETNRAIGQSGLELVPQSARLLTHCNAGALATVGYGTALGVVRAAVADGRDVSVIADETRPFLQGSRLTAWELQRDGIPVTVITDNMAGHLMQRGEVDLVVVGADRVVANGDVANKIGTYPLAVLAREHAVPFYVAAPLSTVDLATPNGDQVPIEERSAKEVLEISGVRLAPDEVSARHPAFDITPARLVSAIITERGIARAPYPESLRELVSSS